MSLSAALIANAWKRAGGAAGRGVDTPADLMIGLGIPGAACRYLMAESGGAWNEDRIPAVLATPGGVTVDQVVGAIGPNNAAVCRALAAQWAAAERSGFWSPDQIKRAQAACLGGVLCFAGTAGMVSNLSPGIAPDLVTPAAAGARQDAWAAVVNEFSTVTRAYFRGQMADAARAAAASARNVTFWDTVYVATKAVADAPAAVAGAVSSSTVSFLGGMLGATWPLLLMAGAGWLLWSTWPALSAAAVRKVKERVEAA